VIIPPRLFILRVRSS